MVTADQLKWLLYNSRSSTDGVGSNASCTHTFITNKKVVILSVDLTSVVKPEPTA